MLRHAPLALLLTCSVARSKNVAGRHDGPSDAFAKDVAKLTCEQKEQLLLRIHRNELEPKGLELAVMQYAEHKAVSVNIAAETSSFDNPLAQWFEKHKKGTPGAALVKHRRVANKWDSYLPTYHRYLSKWIGKPVNVLEFGVQSGGSMQMWLDYFGDKAHAYGVDIEPAVAEFSNERDRITTFVGDMGNPDFLRSLCKKIPRIDFILDDGSHIGWHEILAFEILFPCLNPDGGIFMTEDLTSSYYTTPPFDGGVRRNGTFIEFAKGKVDELNALWAVGGKPLKWNVDPTKYTRTMHAISFHDNIIVFEKTRSKQMANGLVAGEKYLPKRFNPSQAMEGTSGSKMFDKSMAHQRQTELESQPDFWPDVAGEPIRTPVLPIPTVIPDEAPSRHGSKGASSSKHGKGLK